MYKTLTRPGVLNGLQLVMNVEQYEYINGPHAAAGLKVLLHEQGTIPMVENFAVAVPVGMNTFVAVRIAKVNPIDNPKNRNQHLILVRC